jgi:UDP-N-acetylglucosamine 2-epimerase (non-hydrolysing)
MTRPSTIVYVVGARPNFVKMAPVIAALQARDPAVDHVLIHTGQHFDTQMSDVFFAELDIPAPRHTLGIGPGTHGEQTARVLTRLEPLLDELRPELVLVPGDVNSTLGATLVAAKLGIPIGHVESGLRSFDRSMPEEINRIVADEFSSYCFTHSEEANDNLRREGIADDAIHFVGNTMIDTLVALQPRFQAQQAAANLGLRERDYLLVTLHRPSLVDGPLLDDVLRRLDEVGKALPVVFPVHPRTHARIGHGNKPRRVNLVPPLGYLDFLSLEADATAVLTDSGGVQEETTFLGVPCFTLRSSTERPVTIRAGTNVLLGLDPDAIDDILPALDRPRELRAAPALWDGRAASRIAEVVLDGSLEWSAAAGEEGTRLASSAG